MDETHFKKIASTLILIVLIVLSFFLIKPLLLPVILGIILAFIFSPVYKWLLKFTKSKNLTAFLILFFFTLLIIIPVWLSIPVIVNQFFQIYETVTHTDFTTPLKEFFPSLFSSPATLNIIESVIDSSFSKITNLVANSLSIDNLVSISLQLLIIFFTFFFVLRDQDRFIAYIQSVLPFPKEIEKKLFDSSRDITISVIYGQFIIGFIQGIVTGAGFFIFGVPNALFLTFLAIIAGILPIIGTTVVWIPVAIYAFISGDSFAALGISFFGIFSSFLENLLRAIIISKRTNMNSSLILIGMIGGLFSFGFIGLILGPLVIAYLLILLEFYRDKKTPGLLIPPSSQ